MLLSPHFWCHIKKSLPRSMSRNFFHMSSCRNFTTSGLIFKAFIHFKIIYVSGVKQRSHFFSFFSLWLILPQSFPGGSVVKNTPANTRDARDTGSIPGSGRSLGGGNGNLLQNSCLDNPIYRIRKESDMTGQLNNNKGMIWFKILFDVLYFIFSYLWSVQLFGHWRILSSIKRKPKIFH